MAAAFAALLAVPAAHAFGVGIGEEAGGITDLQAAGGHVAYGQIWAGPWMKSAGWDWWDAQLGRIRDSGATPVILWYYWGDSISSSCVASGCNGRTVSDWEAMSRTMASHARAVMGDAEFLVVLEPEFNKGGIHGDPFDGMLAAQSQAVKQIAPAAKTVVGFGSWGGYANFPKAVASADYTGFQWMRGVTHESADSALRLVDSALGTTQQLRALYPDKPVLLFDLAIATYGGWEGVQQQALSDLAARFPELEAAGLVGVVYRYAGDNALSSGYYGPAESTWGLRHADGSAKGGWSAFVALAQAATGGAAAVPANPFANVRGNAWWEEADVAGAPTSVSVSVDGATPVALARTAWGSWAASTFAGPGAMVAFMASYADGSTRSASYPWPPVG